MTPSIADQLAHLRQCQPKFGVKEQGPHCGAALISAQQDIAVVYAIKLGYNVPVQIAAHTGLKTRAIDSALKRLVDVEVLCAHTAGHLTRYTLHE